MLENIYSDVKNDNVDILECLIDEIPTLLVQKMQRVALGMNWNIMGCTCLSAWLRGCQQSVQAGRKSG